MSGVVGDGSPTALDLHEPDAMGVHDEIGDAIWLPHSLYPKRTDAIRWWMDFTSGHFLDAVSANQVPWLRSGSGMTPADGGCIMQIIDWIDRRGWTDAPACVHPVTRALAIEVNDRLDDVGRQRLLDLAPRMMGTAGGDEALTRRLLGWLARQSYPLYSAWAEASGYDDQGAVLACVEAAENGQAAEAAEAAGAAARAAWAARAAEGAWAAARAAEAAWAAARAAEAAWAAARAAEAACAAAATADYLDLIVGLLDRYDELVPRGESRSVDFGPVCAVLPERFVVARDA